MTHTTPVRTSRSLTLWFAISMSGLLSGPSFAQDAIEVIKCDKFRGQSPAEHEQAAEPSIRIADNDDLILPDGSLLGLGDIHFADHMPGLPDTLRQSLRSARQQIQVSIMARKSLIACALSTGNEGAERDRYNRLLGDAVGLSEGFSLRRHLISQGLALVRPYPSSNDCCARLYRAEARARTLGKGVWASAVPLIRKTDARSGAVRLPQSDFTIVEGRVRSVGDRERDIYLNFGNVWASDFTVTINRKAFSGTGSEMEELTALAGRRIRVRGIADEWYGGRIEVTDFRQIEILTAPKKPVRSPLPANKHNTNP